MAFRKRSLKTGWGKGVVGCMLSSWTFFWLVGGEVIGSQHHQPSGSQMLWGLCACGQQKLTSSTWWGFQYLQNSSKDMAQNISCSPWGGTKGPWLCLMATIVILSCLTVFLSLCIFSLLWLNLFFGTQGRPKRLKFSYRREAGGGHARESGGGGWGGLSPKGPIGSCSVTLGICHFYKDFMGTKLKMIMQSTVKSNMTSSVCMTVLNQEPKSEGNAK